MDPNHTLFDSFQSARSSIIFLMFFFLFFFIDYSVQFGKVLLNLFCRAFRDPERLKKVEHYFGDDWNFSHLIDEDLGTYWQCIPGLEQKRWFAAELHYRNCMRIQTLDDENLKML